jgi:hypothetical protein
MIFRMCRFSLVLLLCLLILPHRLSAQQWIPERSAASVLGFEGRRALELARLRYRDDRLEDEPVYQSLWLRESGARDSIVFDLLPFAAAPRRRDGVALAYDQGTGSRMWSGFTDDDPLRSALLGTAAQALLALWSLRLGIGGGPRALVDGNRCPGARLRLGSEMLQGFGTDGRDAPVGTHAVILYADCQRDLGGSWQVASGVRGYHWRTPGMPDRQDLESSVRITHVQPGDGWLLFAEGDWTPRYERGILHIEHPFHLGQFKLRPLARLGWGDRLPFGLGFWPGGFDGFPGIKDGEGRGDRESMLALDLSRHVTGKLSFRALLAAGRTALGGPLLPQAPWLVGARAGLNLDTRFGLLRVEYGCAMEGHRAFFLRLGRVL